MWHHNAFTAAAQPLLTDWAEPYGPNATGAARVLPRGDVNGWIERQTCRSISTVRRWGMLSYSIWRDGIWADVRALFVSSGGRCGQTMAIPTCWSACGILTEVVDSVYFCRIWIIHGSRGYPPAKEASADRRDRHYAQPSATLNRQMDFGDVFTLAMDPASSDGNDNVGQWKWFFKLVAGIGKSS